MIHGKRVDMDIEFFSSDAVEMHQIKQTRGWVDFLRNAYESDEVFPLMIFDEIRQVKVTGITTADDGEEEFQITVVG